MSGQTLLQQTGNFHAFSVSTGWNRSHFWIKKTPNSFIAYMMVGIHIKKSLFLCNRAFSVQKVHLLQSRVLRGRSVHVLLLVMGLSAPRVVEASIAVAWDSRSPLEAAVRDSTADRGPSLQYENHFLRCKELLIIEFYSWPCKIFHKVFLFWLPIISSLTKNFFMLVQTLTETSAETPVWKKMDEL